MRQTLKESTVFQTFPSQEPRLVVLDGHNIDEPQYRTASVDPRSSRSRPTEWGNLIFDLWSPIFVTVSLEGGESVRSVSEPSEETEEDGTTESSGLHFFFYNSVKIGSTVVSFHSHIGWMREHANLRDSNERLENYLNRQPCSLSIALWSEWSDPDNEVEIIHSRLLSLFSVVSRSAFIRDRCVLFEWESRVQPGGPFDGEKLGLFRINIFLKFRLSDWR